MKGFTEHSSFIIEFNWQAFQASKSKKGGRRNERNKAPPFVVRFSLGYVIALFFFRIVSLTARCSRLVLCKSDKGEREEAYTCRVCVLL